jgi:oligopeptide transport system ATP-binding protein
MSPVLMNVLGLSKSFPLTNAFWEKEKQKIALEKVSFQIQKGETLGLVGESGSGKSTLARCLMRLTDPQQGTIEFQGQDITALKGRPLQPIRRKIQMIFQDPMASLNPRMTIGDTLAEPLLIHGIRRVSKELQTRVAELLRLVGLEEGMKSRYPREFSGGQRQRICIARALAVEPELIICDEAVSSLDVSIQAQILQLLMDLQKQMGLTYLFISHDLRVIERISSRVAVMSQGQIVEIASTETLFKNPQHAHTKRLLASRLSLPFPRTPGNDLF